MSRGFNPIDAQMTGELDFAVQFNAVVFKILRSQILASDGGIVDGGGYLLNTYIHT